MAVIRNDILVKPVREVERTWFTRKGAAEYLGVSVDFIKGLNQTGKLKFSKLGGLVFIQKDVLDRLLKRSKVY